MASVKMTAAQFLVFCLVFLFFTGQAPGAGSLNELADELVEQLAARSGLQAAAIQLSSAGFVEQRGGMRPPFSAQLAEALSASLTSHGAKVSLQESGEEPLRLVGTYFHDGEKALVTVRLRKMGRTASLDLAAASGSVDVGTELFRNSLETLAAALVRQLESSWLAPGNPGFVVEQPVPGTPGQPTLRLGSSLKTELQRALKGSELFGAVDVAGRSTRAVYLHSSYTIGGQVMFSAELREKDNTLLGLARGALQKDELPDLLFEMVEDRGREVCLAYSPADSRAVPQSSPTAGLLLDRITSTLDRAGIHSVSCADQDQGIRLVATLQVSKKAMADGYGLLKGVLHVNVFDGGSAAGSISARADHPFTGNAVDARWRLVEKLFTPRLENQLTSRVLAWRGNHGAVKQTE